MITNIKNAYKSKKSSEKAFVVSADDPEGQNRVLLYIPSLQNSKNLLSIYTKWCACALETIPSEGDVVTVNYENDDSRVPIVVANITQSMTRDSSDTSNITTTYSIDSSTLLGIIKDIIIYHEAGSTVDYASVVPNDNNDGVSVGIIGWHANNARDDIFKNIKKTSTADWGQGGKLRSLTTSWYGYVPNDSEVSIMKTILNTSTGHDVQDSVIDDYINGYLADAKNAGMTDAKCLVYYCDIANQGSSDAVSYLKWAVSKDSTCLNDITKLHKVTKSGTGWPTETQANINRRDDTYAKILALEEEGKFSEVQTVEYDDNSLKVLWPFPGFPKISYGFGYPAGYGGYHCGADINHDGNTKGVTTCKNQPVVACCNGSALFTSTEWGNSVRISRTNVSNFYCYYFHLDHFADGYEANNTYTVKANDILGYAGETGKKCHGPHLHFEIRNGGTDDGSRSEASHGYCVDPEPWMMLDGESNKGETAAGTNSIDYDVITRKTTNPLLAQTDCSICQLNELIPFVSYYGYYGRSQFSLGSNYSPGSLMPIVQQSFDEMKAAGISELGENYKDYFAIKKGFRSFTEQMKLHELRKKEEPTTYSITSLAGFSEHQLGLAIDLYVDSMNLYEKSGSEFTDIVIPWVIANSYKYGFIIRYNQGKEQITGYVYKPYHLRYVGVDVATAVYNNGTYLALEEILKTTQ